MNDRRKARGSVAPAPQVLAGVLGVCIAAFGVTGAIVGAEESDSWFHLENEFTAPAYFSAALLLAAGAFAWLVVRRSEDQMRLAWFALAALWLVMGVDEVASLHERIERRAGVDWQLLYLPVAAAGGVAWLVAVRGSDRTTRILLALGAAAWVAAQVLENLQWDSNDNRVAAFEPMMVAEEILEMTGSTLFLLAVYLCWSGRRPPADRRSTPSNDPASLDQELMAAGSASPTES